MGILRVPLPFPFLSFPSAGPLPPAEIRQLADAQKDMLSVVCRRRLPPPTCSLPRVCATTPPVTKTGTLMDRRVQSPVPEIRQASPGAVCGS